jgi:predicted outer membrane repeat protein
VSSVFRDNVSDNNGGAVDLSGGWGVLDASFFDTLFEGNRAGLGGAIQAGGVGTELVRLTDSSLLANSATTTGGAIFIDTTTTVDVTNVDFGSAASDNRPDDIPGGAGWSSAATFRCAAGVCL